MSNYPPASTVPPFPLVTDFPLAPVLIDGTPSLGLFGRAEEDFKATPMGGAAAAIRGLF